MTDTHSRPARRRLIGASVATALVAASLTLVVTPANAATETLDPANELYGGDYTTTLSPTGRSTPVSGLGSAWQSGPDSIDVSKGCPEGHRGGSRTYLLTATQRLFVAEERWNAAVAGSGLDGLPIHLTGTLASTWTSFYSSSGVLTASIQNETATLVITCDAEFVGGSAAVPIGDAPYFKTQIDFSRGNGGTWQVHGAVVKADTSTTLTVSGVTATSATLSVQVTPAGATGTVQFVRDGTNDGAPVVLDTNGAAMLAVSGLEPDSALEYVARYSGDETHNPSVSALKYVVTDPAPPVEVADSSESPLAVTVPQVAVAEPTGLKISAKPGAVTLTGAAERTEGQTWTATGQLGSVTVNDDRQDAGAGAWTLNGRSSSFASGTNTIAASNLSWTPSLVGTGNTGTAGQSATDLSSDKALATGAATADANAMTTVKAGLSLAVPASAASGSYTATLTLTLI